jgi:hypothetical protein
MSVTSRWVASGPPHRILYQSEVPESQTKLVAARPTITVLERTPKDATHWSRASMAAETGLSRSTVGRIWRAFSLKPHLVDTFKLSTDPLFIEKVRDVVGLYLDPPERALVLCVDEKTGIHALDRSSPVLPMMPGMPERRTHDYARSGVTTSFAALDVASGQVIGSLHRRIGRWSSWSPTPVYALVSRV